MNNYNYHSNIFFLVNQYYVYIQNPQNTLKYNFYFNNGYYLKILNKNNEPLNIFFKILNKNNECYYYKIFKIKLNHFQLFDFEKLKYNNNHTDDIFVNTDLLNNIISKYEKLEINLYNENLFNYKIDNLSKNFLYFNWLYFGRYNKYEQFKYILYKNKTLFFEIFQKHKINLSYNKNKKYSLIFIDDRFDSIFEYILITFLYSIDDNWNLYIYTTESNSVNYKKILSSLEIQAKIIIINKFKNVNEYSNLLKSNNFWESITEDYVLFFQYDSLAFSKFNYKFLNYNYIGAQWPHHIQQIKGIFNGNGGVSLRDVKIMKMITKKYNFMIYNELNTPEDKYFSKYLFKEKILMNEPKKCDEFSFENNYSDTSIYGHAIYESIKLDKLENYICNRLQKLLFIS